MNEPHVIYEDENLLGINKPSGLLVHPVRDLLKEETLVAWLLSRYPEIQDVGDDLSLRPGIVHRLDKDTSGVIVIPKNQHTFLYLKSLFQRHLITKKYFALVSGRMQEDRGVIDKPIGIRNGTVKRSIHATKMQKEAITEYSVQKEFEVEGKPFSLLEVIPRTGRTHQIRVHLASLGHPVLGDALYGSKQQPEWVHRLMLHAFSLEFTRQDGGRLKLEADLPKDFEIPE